MTREDFELAVQVAHRIVTSGTARTFLPADDVVIEVNPVTFTKLMVDGIIVLTQPTSANWTLGTWRHTYMETSDGHPVRSTRRVREARQVRGVFEAEAWVEIQ